MGYIINFLMKLIPKELPKPLGRWKVEHCNKKMNTKIDLSNEDHCGPCGQYAKTKTELQNKIVVFDKTKNMKIY
jgi:hypothetical protein